MASARNLCQHSDIDGSQCTSTDYIFCPHCQLQLCLKHLNTHQDLLRGDFYTLCDQINRVHSELDDLIFDSMNHRNDLFAKLDRWYAEQIDSIDRIYREKRQQLEDVCLQARMEFEVCKAKKDQQLKENLFKHVKRVCKQKQVHSDDLNDMKSKLNQIERGLDELRQLLIDIHYEQPNINIQIIKRRYVEAAKTSITEDEDDDDDHQWDVDDEENLRPSSPTTIEKNPPLKLIIKRLHNSTKSKYKFHTPPSPLLT